MNFYSFDEDYLSRLKAGDPDTERHFVAYFGETIGMRLRSRIRSPELAEEIRQETFFRVIKVLREGRELTAERFGGFVHGVCVNVSLEMIRAEVRHAPACEEGFDPPDPHSDLDAPLVTAETKGRITAILSELPPKDRDLLRAVFLAEHDRDELCKRFHVGPEYLRVLVYRAKQKFRRHYVRKFPESRP